MNLSPHFTLAEFTVSQLAKRRGIDNALPPDLLPAAMNTAQLLERIRARLSHLAGRDIPLRVTSGYRCVELNRALGSGDGSDHVRAMAADFVAPAFGTAFQVASALEPVVDELQLGQLIHEFGDWVHVSTRVPANPVNRVITISAAGTRPGVLEVA
ncbi:MAG TPA: D-Ala-D-Ala carboxypeptidase family metallohydrolase [Ramlibacter sp.]|nr:D-Ala-D-Ala carboxypeptidase family metallohydrolase [Ramlibacter sp.]